MAAAPLLVPAALALVFWRAAPPWMRLTVAVVTVQLAVVVYEGRDHFALFRFLVPAVPFLSMLAVFALCMLGTRLRTARGETIGIALAVVLMLVGGQWVGRNPHRGDDEGRTEMARLQQEVRSAREWSAMGRWFRHTAPSQASLATIAVGAIGYYSGLVIVDPHGVIDPVVAHRAVSLGGGYAGHEKYDVGYVLSRRPDYVLVLNYITRDPVPVEDLPVRVWGDFNRQILQDGRFFGRLSTRGHQADRPGHPEPACEGRCARPRSARATEFLMPRFRFHCH